MAGTSAGALIAALSAAGYSSKEMLDTATRSNIIASLGARFRLRGPMDLFSRKGWAFIRVLRLVIEILSPQSCFLNGEDRGPFFEAPARSVERATSEHVPALVGWAIPMQNAARGNVTGVSELLVTNYVPRRVPQCAVRLRAASVTGHCSFREIDDIVLLHMRAQHVAAFLIGLDHEQMDGHVVLRPSPI
ncbi:hypothetical protein HDG35_006358 [Paraburkholderia sp. JPY681]|nr:hypothetical protein [Paraburkholderia atlantica]